MGVGVSYLKYDMSRSGRAARRVTHAHTTPMIARVQAMVRRGTWKGKTITTSLSTVMTEKEIDRHR